jgi:anaerobic carbon-monoxide dehydrogenase iron sulfur subunit
MKKVLAPYADKCIACHACESACSLLYFKADDATRSCIRINETEQEPQMNVCSQCGICIQTCPTQALKYSASGVVLLNKSQCINCLMCVAACPTASMMHYDGNLTPFKCIACGSCVKVCPAGAIEIVQKEEHTS